MHVLRLIRLAQHPPHLVTHTAYEGGVCCLRVSISPKDAAGASDEVQRAHQLLLREALCEAVKLALPEVRDEELEPRVRPRAALEIVSLQLGIHGDDLPVLPGIHRGA